MWLIDSTWDIQLSNDWILLPVSIRLWYFVISLPDNNLFSVIKDDLVVAKLQVYSYNML